MTPKAWSLLVAVGVVAGVVVAVPKPGVTKADLIDAGIAADCTKKERTCLIYSPDGTDCPDAGHYCAKTVGFMLCPVDGGIPRTAITKRAVEDRIPDDGAWCGQARATTLNADDVVDAPFDCACAASSACKLVDGGAAPLGVTLQPGAFTASAACVSKPCVGLFVTDGGATVDETWPTGCP